MMISITYKIPDMHCTNCVMKLEGLEDDLPGVISAQASYHNQTLKINFDDEMLSESAIRDAVQALGYTIY